MEKEPEKPPDPKPPSQLKLRLPLTITTNVEPPEMKDGTQNSKMSPTTVKDVKEIILSSSKNILGKVLSPSKDKITQKDSVKKIEKMEKVEIKKPILMTRRELTDPFGSDDEDETMEVPASDKTEMNSCNDTSVVEVDNKIGDMNDAKDITIPVPTQVIYFL